MYFLVCDSFTFTLNLTGTLNRSKPLFLSQIPIWCHHVRLLPWLGWPISPQTCAIGQSKRKLWKNRWYHWYVTNSKAYKTQSLFIKIPFTLCYSGCSKVVLAQFLTIKRSLKIIYNKLLNYNFQRTQHIMLKDETVSMTMKILLNNFGRRKVVYYSVILTSFVLIVQWQFYASSQTKLTADATENNIQSLGTSNRLILGGDENRISFLNSNETCILATTNMPSYLR